MTKSDSWESPEIFTIAFNKHVTKCAEQLQMCEKQYKLSKVSDTLLYSLLAQTHFRQIWTHSSENRFACLGQQTHNGISWCGQEYVHFYIDQVNTVCSEMIT